MQYNMTDPALQAGSAETHDKIPPYELRHASLHSTASESTTGNVTDESASSAPRTSDLSHPQWAASQSAVGPHRSSTPPDQSGAGSVKYTRTGRISKAAKGQRIHHCDECGKTYTRAEHLRRHQQNHKPGAFPCDVQGCGRSFYREDLLTRHKMRHNDPLNPPSRRHSEAGQSPNPNTERGPAPAPAPILGFAGPAISYSNIGSPHLQTQSAPSENAGQQGSTSPRPPKRLPVPPNELMGAIPIEIGAPQSLYDFRRRCPYESSIIYDHDYDSDHDSDDETCSPFYRAQNISRLRYAAPDNVHHEIRLRGSWTQPSRDQASEVSPRPPYNRVHASCGQRTHGENIVGKRTRELQGDSRSADHILKELKQQLEGGCGRRKIDLEAEIAEIAYEQSCVLAYWSRVRSADSESE